MFTDLSDGQRWSNVQRVQTPGISSSDTYSRSVSREVPCAIPWDTFPTPIPFQSAEDLLDAEITDAIIKDDVEAIKKCEIVPFSKVADKVLILSSRLGEFLIWVNLL